VAVVKLARQLNLGPPVKDSDRFFAAGADVLARDYQEDFFRCRSEGGRDNLPAALQRLSCRYDLVLVEGHRDTPVPKVWLLDESEQAPPPAARDIITVLADRKDRLSRLLEIIHLKLQQDVQSRPTIAAVLIGGQSRRMGRTKHLLPHHNGRSWLEATVAMLETMGLPVAIAGGGRIPESLLHVPNLPDVLGVPGPLGGILAAMRWQPAANWIVVACDLPKMSQDAIQWLLSQQRPGVWACLPVQEDGLPQPLLALYGFRSRMLLEEQVLDGTFRPGAIASHRKVLAPMVPLNLEESWFNANSPDDLQRLNFGRNCSLT
jgi:molybdopterin-guanine dinucleotide biosynthesis protein MobB